MAKLIRTALLMGQGLLMYSIGYDCCHWQYWAMMGASLGVAISTIWE